MKRILVSNQSSAENVHGEIPVWVGDTIEIDNVISGMNVYIPNYKMFVTVTNYERGFITTKFGRLATNRNEILALGERPSLRNFLLERKEGEEYSYFVPDPSFLNREVDKTNLIDVTNRIIEIRTIHLKDDPIKKEMLNVELKTLLNIQEILEKQQ